jgi:hypothetical protein
MVKSALDNGAKEGENMVNYFNDLWSKIAEHDCRYKYMDWAGIGMSL